jgi:hypothetical protein
VTLRPFGLKVGRIGNSAFASRIRELVADRPRLSLCMEALLEAREVLLAQLAKMRATLLRTVKNDELDGTVTKGRRGGGLPRLFPRPLGALEKRSAAHITHELTNILVSGGTLRADLRGSPGKLLAYRRFDRGCLSASQLLQKCPVYPLVCRIAYDSHCIEHCHRSYFAALLVSTLALRASIRRRDKR